MRRVVATAKVLCVACMVGAGTSAQADLVETKPDSEMVFATEHSSIERAEPLFNIVFDRMEMANSESWTYTPGPGDQLVTEGVKEGELRVPGSIWNEERQIEGEPASGREASEVAAVPLPGALSLFATGLVGLGLLHWRRKRKQVAP